MLWLVLLIGVAWAFGALWFDSPFPALRRPLAVVFAVSAVVALLFTRPRWRAQLGVAAVIRHNVEDIGYAKRWDWQILINGYIAERAYALGAIDTSLPLPELRRVSLINDRARVGGDGPGFSERIREGLPGIPPAVP